MNLKNEIILVDLTDNLDIKMSKYFLNLIDFRLYWELYNYELDFELESELDKVVRDQK